MQEKVEVSIIGECIEAELIKNKITVKGIKDGTATVKISVNGTEYEEITAMVGWIAIYTEQDLMKMKDGLDKHYILMNGIILTKEWEAIGDSTSPFTGELEGNYHKIEGLTINKSNSDYQGLFGCLDGYVRNLTLEIDIVGHNYVGGVAGCVYGNVNENVIENVKVIGSIEGTAYNIGGLVGALNSGIVERCFSEVTVVGANDNVGGLIGNSNGDVMKSASIGNVSGKQYVGGLVGNQCGKIENAYSRGEVTGSCRVGGLVGIKVGSISNVYTISRVSGPLNDDRVGGYIGVHQGGSDANVYWTPEKAGRKENGWWDNDYVQSEEQMQMQLTYLGFDFTSESPIWVMKKYPELNYNFGNR